VTLGIRPFSLGRDDRNSANSTPEAALSQLLPTAQRIGLLKVANSICIVATKSSEVNVLNLAKQVISLQVKVLGFILLRSMGRSV